jgi:glycosyltransferase involved in cell wall biosynthesis
VAVAVRGDLRGSLAGADFEIVQNGASADGRRRFHVPHWPQPGLVPRDSERGDRLERIAFKGYAANLHPDFRSAEWTGFLAGLGIEWVTDAVDFAGAATDRAALAWPDFRTIDAVVAVRPPRIDVAGKPAAKLANAWLAGVPALLGPEPAYRELRRDPLDYFEVRSLAEARAAVERLRAEPGLYRAMVDNGRRRAAEVSVAAVTAAWRKLLERTLPPLTRAPRPLSRRIARRFDSLRFRDAG